VSVQKLENAIEFYGAISHNKLHGLSVQVETNHVKLPQVVDGFASEGIIQFFFEESGDDAGLTSIFWMRATAPRCITTVKAVKRSWCATSAASTRHRTIVSPTAPALSTSTCRSSIRLSTLTAARR
jgi:adenylate cyclase class 1